MYTYQEDDRIYTLDDCKNCNGSGNQTWNTGHGDMSPGFCNTCHGTGQIPRLVGTVQKIQA